MQAEACRSSTPCRCALPLPPLPPPPLPLLLLLLSPFYELCVLAQLCILPVRCALAQPSMTVLQDFGSLCPLLVSESYVFHFLVSQKPLSTSLQGSQFLGCIFILVGGELTGFPVLQVAVQGMFSNSSFRGSHLMAACVLFR